jgi:DNA-binding PadR family transcriptional regulator
VEEFFDMHKTQKIILKFLAHGINNSHALYTAFLESGRFHIKKSDVNQAIQNLKNNGYISIRKIKRIFRRDGCAHSYALTKKGVTGYHYWWGKQEK